MNFRTEAFRSVEYRIITHFAFAVLIAVFGLVHGAVAQTTIVVSKPKERFPISIPNPCFFGLPPGAAAAVAQTMAKDLEISGLFDVKNPESYISNRDICISGSVEDYSDWRLIKSDWLVRGAITRGPGGIDVRLYLHDVTSGRQVLGKEYHGTERDLPGMTHRFSNAVLKFITGEEGPFGSKIAFVSRVGRFKEIFVMDIDGTNVRQMTREKGLALSPSWNPKGDLLLYTSYQRRVPDLFVLPFPTGGARSLTRSPALEVGGRFSPDGQYVISSISGTGKGSDLALFDRTGRVQQVIGRGNGSIDISPSFAPDGREIVFCSDRSGSPQIYRTSLGGGEAHRVSFVNSSYCTSPDWSPKGDKLAYVCRVNGLFQLFVSQADGSQSTQITDHGNNEDPSWSPDGKYLAFASTFGKRSGFDIAVLRLADRYQNSSMNQITFNPADDTDPSWGPI
jgi:TolB protein